MGRTSGGSFENGPGLNVRLNPNFTSTVNGGLVTTALANAKPGSTVTLDTSEGQVTLLGGFVYPGGIRLTATGGQVRPPLEACGIKADPAMTAGFMFASNAWANSTANPDVGCEVDHLSIDMNGIAAHGIVGCLRNGKIHDNAVYNWSGAFSGIVVGSTASTTGVNNNNVIRDNFAQIVSPSATVGQHCIWVPNNGGQNVTDMDIRDNFVNGCGDDIIRCDTGGNINCYNNHGSTLTADTSAFIHYATMGGSEIIGNRMDDTSRPNASGKTNSCILVDTVVNTPAVRQSKIAGNVLHADESHSAGLANWTYISVTGATTAHSYIAVEDNDITQDAAGSGTSNGYNYVANSGVTMVVTHRPGQTFGTSALANTSGVGNVNLTGSLPRSSWSFPSNPTATSNTSATAMGLAIPLVSQQTGNFEVTVYGDLSTATGAAQVTLSGHYGTGGAPANGATTGLGTQAPAGALLGKASAANTSIPFTLPSGIIPNGVPGTVGWYDVCIFTSAGADAASITNLSVNVREVI